MNRILFLALVASAAVAGTMSARLGQVDPPVNLQAATPGTQQVGNTNISGKMIVGSLSVFLHVRGALCMIWKLEPPRGSTIVGFFLNYLLALIMVLCTAVLLL